jgi:hypothetical protein
MNPQEESAHSVSAAAVTEGNPPLGRKPYLPEEAPLGSRAANSEKEPPDKARAEAERVARARITVELAREVGDA